VLGRPTLLSVPAFAARLAFGEMADALLLASARVEPARLNEAGFEFKHTNIEDALRHLLKKG
jgi:NAD dependent epimerase/dehydratase family enzyme